MFLGIIDLAQPNIITALLVGVFQFFQIKFITPKKKKGTDDFAGKMQRQMVYFMPVLIVVILWGLPSALAIYIITTTLFTIVQQYIIVKKKNVEPR